MKDREAWYIGLKKEKPEPEIKKSYYKIGEVATTLDVPTWKIRGWCKDFQIEAMRRGNNVRMFTDLQFFKLHKIKVLIEDEGYTLKGALKKYNAKASSPSPTAE